MHTLSSYLTVDFSYGKLSVELKLGSELILRQVLATSHPLPPFGHTPSCMRVELCRLAVYSFRKRNGSIFA
jgi:hypothetical protein